MTDEEELFQTLFADPGADPDDPRSGIEKRDEIPAYVDQTPVPVERRPYLELTQEELERNATLEVEPGPARRIAPMGPFERLVDRMMLGPLRLVTDNIAVIVAAIAVIVMLMAATALLGEVVGRWFALP